MFSYLLKTKLNVRNIVRCCASMKLICAFALAGWVMASMLPLQANGQDLVPVQPSPWHCGTVGVGDDSYNWFGVINQGAATLTVNSTDITGTDAGDFSVTDGDAPFTLDPGVDRTMEIHFMPSSSGLKSATLSFYDAAPTLLLEVELKGNGPDINTDVTPWGFGTWTVGEQWDNWFNIYNQGDETLNVSSMEITAGDVDDFSIEGGHAPFSVDPDPMMMMPHSVQIRFSPQSGGSRSATLTIESNDPDEATLEIELQGNGQEPDIDPGGTPWDCGDEVVGNENYLGFNICNNGDGTLHVTETTITAGDQDFEIWSGHAPFDVGPGGDCGGIQIRFSPQSTGIRTGTLTVVSNDPDGSPLDIPLQGNGTQPDIAVTPTDHDFGPVEVGCGVYPEKTFIVENTGTAWLYVNNPYIADDDGQFWIEDNSSFGLNPGETRQIIVGFNPQWDGDHSANLRLHNNVPSKDPVDVQLDGQGISLAWSVRLLTSIPGCTIESEIAACSYAEDGLDELDVAYPPEDPPGETPDLDAYLEGVAPLPKLSRDCRLEESHDTFDKKWTLHVRSESDDFDIWWESWEPPGDLHATIEQTLPAGGPFVNMREQENFYESFPGGQDYEFEIRVSYKVKVILEVPQGWSMRSVPGEPDPPISIPDLASGNPDVSNQVYTWNTANEAYDLADGATMLTFGDAYWFYATADTELVVEDCKLSNTLTRDDIEAGWTMVGGVCEHVPVNRLKGDVLKTVYRWDGGSEKYELVDAVKPKEGYWMASISGGTLTIDNTVPAPPAIQSQPIVGTIRPTWESVIAIQTQTQHQELIFGMHPSASGSFDSLLDRPHPPLPVGLSDGLKAGWMAEDTVFSLLDKSYVRDDPRAIWELSVELPESGELRWRDLPTEYRCLLWYDGQVIQMQRERDISLPAGMHNLRLVLDAFGALPQRTELLANYPNPANPETWIPYRLAEDGDVTLVIYDASGREIRRFHLHSQLAGEYQDKEHAIHWDGKNYAGEPVSSGVYFHSLQAAGSVSDETKVSQTGKLVIIR